MGHFSEMGGGGAASESDRYNTPSNTQRECPSYDKLDREALWRHVAQPIGLVVSLMLAERMPSEHGVSMPRVHTARSQVICGGGVAYTLYMTGNNNNTSVAAALKSGRWTKIAYLHSKLRPSNKRPANFCDSQISR